MLPLVRYEFYDGQPVVLPSPSDLHQEVSGELFRQLANHLLKKRCKVYAAPFDVRLFEGQEDSPEDVDTVVCATDAGREGELIFRLTYDLCKCAKPVKRLWISSMEESAIRKG